MTPSRAGDRCEAARGGTVAFDGGLVEIGHDGRGFAFDNEGPAHRRVAGAVSLWPRDLVTNGDWMRFIDGRRLWPAPSCGCPTAGRR